MSIWDSLGIDGIHIGSDAKSADEVIREIAVLAAAQPGLQGHSAVEIEKALKARERLASTGLEGGIAIPHCSLDDLREFTVGVVTLKRGVDFKAADKRASDIFIYIIGPTTERNRHISLLSAIMKALQQQSVRDLLRSANSAKTVMDIFRSQIQHTEPVETGLGRSLVRIAIQREEHFSEIMQLLSAESDISIAVIETETASRYLHRMPLFAAFWSDPESRFSREITAVVRREAVNGLIRRLQTAVPDISTVPGILITVEELSYSIGSIEF